jgi:hypothetical protein
MLRFFGCPCKARVAEEDVHSDIEERVSSLPSTSAYQQTGCSTARFQLVEFSYETQARDVDSRFAKLPWPPIYKLPNREHEYQIYIDVTECRYVLRFVFKNTNVDNDDHEPKFSARRLCDSYQLERYHRESHTLLNTIKRETEKIIWQVLDMPLLDCLVAHKKLENVSLFLTEFQQSSQVLVEDTLLQAGANQLRQVL